MNTNSKPRRQLQIENLQIDMRGVPPAIANDSAHKIGPALSQLLTSESALRTSAAMPESLDLGSIRAHRSSTADTIANEIARRIAQSMIRRER